MRLDYSIKNTAEVKQRQRSPQGSDGLVCIVGNIVDKMRGEKNPTIIKCNVIVIYRHKVAVMYRLGEKSFHCKRTFS